MPLSPLLPENVAELKVIFIANEINIAAFCIQLKLEGLHQLRNKNSLVKEANNKLEGNMVKQTGNKGTEVNMDAFSEHLSSQYTRRDKSNHVKAEKHNNMEAESISTAQLNKAQKPFAIKQKTKTCSKEEKRQDEVEETEASSRSSYYICSPPEPVLN